MNPVPSLLLQKLVLSRGIVSKTYRRHAIDCQAQGVYMMLIPVETAKWPYTIAKYYFTVSKLNSSSCIFKLSVWAVDLLHGETFFFSSIQDQLGASSHFIDICLFSEELFQLSHYFCSICLVRIGFSKSSVAYKYFPLLEIRLLGIYSRENKGRLKCKEKCKIEG